jgi:hypothetical protein
MRAFIARLIVAVLAVATFVAIPLPQTAQAAVAGFSAGNIISDSVFYNTTTTSPGQIQAFLNSKLPSCRSGYTCLKDYRQDTPTVAGDPMCRQYDGAAGESAATIIYKVAVTCGINPQVLIVMLQKEQGLVTDSYPSTGQYRSAMGAGCPDTAACDANYYGFFNQVHYGAYLLKRYTQPAGTGAGTNYSSRFDLSYPVGAWSNVLYNPNANCGTQRVYIENQATHSLYLYTPYTPNTAALNAGYGSGDACSAYGNRNFYLYFTDWFGSTTGSDLVRTATSADVFLVTADGRYRVPSMETVSVLAPLGGVQVVGQDYLDRFPIRGTATSLVRDRVSGSIYLVGGGKRFHIVSCDQLTQFGLSCAGYADLNSSQISRFADGGDLSPFVQTAGSSDVYLLENGKRRLVPDWSTMVAVSAGMPSTAVAALAPSLVSALPLGAPVLAPGRLYMSSASPDVFLADGLSAKRRLDSFGYSADLGAGTAVSVVAQSTLDAYATKDDLSTSAVSCGPDYYIGSGGALWHSSTTTAYGAPVLALDPLTCAALPKASGTTGQNLFVAAAGAPTIYLVSGGVRRPVANWTAYSVLSSTGGGVLLSGMSSAGLSKWSAGDPVYAPGALVKQSNDDKVYVVDGLAGLSWLRSFDLALDLGLNPGLSVVPSLSGYAVRGETGSPLVSCGTDAFVADGGRIAPTTAQADAAIAAVAVEPITCSSLPKSGATGAKLFVKSPGSASVYYISGGQRRLVSSWLSLVTIAGTPNPGIVQWADSTLRALPEGPAS